MVGEAAYQDALETSLPGDLVPLVDILAAKEFTLDTSTYDRTPFPRNRPAEEMKVYGQWVLNILAEAEAPIELATRHFDLMAKLRLGSGPRPVKHALGHSIWDVAQALGAEKKFAPKGAYVDWDIHNYIVNAEKLALSMRDRANPKPTDLDYEQWAREGKGPSPAVIHAQTGYSTRQMNELIGFPNTHEWDKDDFLSWGVEVLAANDGTLNRHIISLLSSDRRGPSVSAIFNRFGSLHRFKELVADRAAWQDGQPHTETDETRLAKHVELLAKHFGADAPASHADRLALAARFEVARRLVVGLRNSEYAQIAYETNASTFIDRLLHENYNLDATQIHGLIQELGFNDLIWRNWRHHLRVDPERLSEQRRRFAVYERNLKRRQRARAQKSEAS